MRANLGLIIATIVLVAATALTGNDAAIDPSAIQDTAALPTPPLDVNVVGQTFRSRYPFLSAIQVRFTVPVETAPPGDALVRLHLRASPTAGSDLATASIPFDQIHNNEFSKFTFASLADSEDKTYYFFFDLTRNAGAFALWSSGQDAYSNGALYINNSVTPRDLSFRAYYSPDPGMLGRALGDEIARFGASAIILALIFLFTFYFLLRATPSSLHIRIAGTLALLAALIIAFLQIRDLPAPLWVDSFMHAQYVHSILSNARLPTENFYHLGFHTLAAIISRTFDLSVPESLLLTGQFSWVLVGIAVFFYSRKISNSVVAGLVSAICVWFLSPTPVYFITWGRYPLVLGSALLPLALFCALHLFERRNARHIIFAALAFAALAFTQVRLLAFYFAFLVIYGALSFRQGNANEKHLHQSQTPEAQRGGTGRALPVTPLFTFRLPITNLFILWTSFLIIPALWLIYLFSHGVTPQSILAQNQAAPSIDLQTALDVLQTHHGIEFFILAAISAILGLVRRSRVTFLMVGWLAALAALALTLSTPILGELVPLSLVALMAFLPAAVLIGDAAQFAYERWRAPNRIVHAAVWIALVGCISLLAARDMINIANPTTILFTRADEDAMGWIRAHVPPQSTFLVNSFNWVGTTYVPSDGGGWIPYFSDNSIVYLDGSASQIDSESARMQWIAGQKLDYVYLGTRAGTLSAAELFSHSEIFSLVYYDSGIRIFRIKPRTGE